MTKCTNSANPSPDARSVAQAFEDFSRIHRQLREGPDVDDDDPIWGKLEKAEEALVSARATTPEDVAAKLSFFRLNNDCVWDFSDDSVELGKRMLDAVAIDVREMMAQAARAPHLSAAGSLGGAA